jgi:hypothetical protein
MATLGLGTLPAEAASTASGTPAVENCGLGSSLVRPGSLILTCADKGMVAKDLRWTSWTDAGATATATVAWSENGSRKSTTANITLSAAVSEGSGGGLGAAGAGSRTGHLGHLAPSSRPVIMVCAALPRQEYGQRRTHHDHPDAGAAARAAWGCWLCSTSARAHDPGHRGPRER